MRMPLGLGSLYWQAYPTPQMLNGGYGGLAPFEVDITNPSVEHLPGADAFVGAWTGGIVGGMTEPTCPMPCPTAYSVGFTASLVQSGVVMECATADRGEDFLPFKTILPHRQIGVLPSADPFGSADQACRVDDAPTDGLWFHSQPFPMVFDERMMNGPGLVHSPWCRWEGYEDPSMQMPFDIRTEGQLFVNLRARLVYDPHTLCLELRAWAVAVAGRQVDFQHIVPIVITLKGGATDVNCPAAIIVSPYSPGPAVGTKRLPPDGDLGAFGCYCMCKPPYQWCEGICGCFNNLCRANCGEPEGEAYPSCDSSHQRFAREIALHGHSEHVVSASWPPEQPFTVENLRNAFASFLPDMSLSEWIAWNFVNTGVSSFTIGAVYPESPWVSGLVQVDVSLKHVNVHRRDGIVAGQHVILKHDARNKLVAILARKPHYDQYTVKARTANGHTVGTAFAPLDSRGQTGFQAKTEDRKRTALTPAGGEHPPEITAVQIVNVDGFLRRNLQHSFNMQERIYDCWCAHANLQLAEILTELGAPYISSNGAGYHYLCRQWRSYDLLRQHLLDGDPGIVAASLYGPLPLRTDIFPDGFDNQTGEYVFSVRGPTGFEGCQGVLGHYADCETLVLVKNFDWALWVESDGSYPLPPTVFETRPGEFCGESCWTMVGQGGRILRALKWGLAELCVLFPDLPGCPDASDDNGKCGWMLTDEGPFKHSDLMPRTWIWKTPRVEVRVAKKGSHLLFRVHYEVDVLREETAFCLTDGGGEIEAPWAGESCEGGPFMPWVVGMGTIEIGWGAQFVAPSLLGGGYEVTCSQCPDGRHLPEWLYTLPQALANAGCNCGPAYDDHPRTVICGNGNALAIYP